MTRDKAIGKIFTGQKNYGDMANLVNEIFDDFENRNCKHCEWLHRAPYGNICLNERNNVANDYGSTEIEFNYKVELDFNCKYWKCKNEDR